jgi:streptomycin 6-kinase
VGVAALAAAGRVAGARSGCDGPLASRPRPLGLRRGGRSGLRQPPSRGGGDRRGAGRSARDDAADRSALGEGVAGASQLRLVLRSRGEGTRGPYGAVGTEAVFAERRKLDDEVERRPESLSELREHAFEKVRWRSDGSRYFLQVPLHGAKAVRVSAETWDAELARLAGYWRGFWPAVDTQRLAADVRDRLEAARRDWGLHQLEPLEGGAVALVCSAVQGGRPVVLKLNPRGHSDDEQLGGEGEALRFWRPTGAAVELLGHRDGGFTLLMPRLGQPLEDIALSREDKLIELGRLAGRLHSAGPAPRSFMHLRDFSLGWRRNVPEIDELLTPSEADVLIHCDLHAGNALRAGEGWRVIDPKGVRADRHADIWALLDPMGLEHLPEDPDAAAETAGRWVDLYAAAAAMDPPTARRWARLGARAEALTLGAEPSSSPDEVAWIAALHRMADALA